MVATDVTEPFWASFESVESGSVATKEATSTRITSPLPSKYLSVGEILTGNFSEPLNSLRNYSKLRQEQNIQTE